MLKYLPLIQHFKIFTLFFIGEVLFLLINSNILLAQTIKPDNIKFLPVEGNLSEGTVTSIVQDYKGVLWFGTRNGLNRYNGIGFSVYEHIYEDSTSLSNSYINCLLEDSEQNLWVGTADGLNLYNRNEDTFKRFRYSSEDKLSLSNNAIYAIFEDSKNIIWIGTEGGLNRYDPKTNSFSRFTNNSKDKNSLSHNYIRAIFEDKKGNIWVGTYGGGLNRYDPINNRFDHYQFESGNRESLSSNYIRVAFKDRDGDIWIGTKGGLNLLQEEDGQFKFKRYLHEINNPNSLPHNIVGAIGQDKNGRLWFGTENGGLSVFDKETNTFSNHFHDPLDPTSITHNSIWSIYQDNVGTMWVGMLNKGINKWDKHQSKFNHYNVNSSENSLSNGNVTCFWEDKDQNLWIGTDGGGLNFFNRKSKRFSHYEHDPLDKKSLGSNAVTAILEDSHNNLWIGTWEGGLNLFDRKTKKVKHYFHDPSDTTSISSNNVFSILEDSQGRLWVAAFEGGLDLFNRDTETFKHFKHDPDNPRSLAHNKVFTLFEDSKQNIWIGTEGGGLSLMQKNGKEISFTNFHHDAENPFSIGGNVIITVAEDRHQNIWIGTFGGGLSRYIPQTHTFKTYRKEHGLPNNVVHAILEDNQGNLWISTNNGIARFDYEAETFRSYSKADGLQSQEFIRGAAYKARNGEMFFGGVNGFNSFYPGEVTDNPNIPPVYITDFSIYGKQVKPGKKGSPLERHISEAEKIILNHDQNVFSFELSALNYSQASENQYAYKLEGYDKDWQYIGTRRNVYYTKVSPGSYVFKVKGSNNDNVWNEAGTSIKVVIRPPWYTTWWAYTVYFILCIVLFYIYRQNLINKERLKSDLKLEQMELSKMQEVDQLKSNFFANISHEFRTPLTLILGPLKSMYAGRFEGDLKSQLQMMIRNGDRLLRLINQLLDLSKLGAGNMKLKASKQDLVAFIKPVVSSFETHAKSHAITMVLNCPDEPLPVYFDPDKLEKIMVNLLSNALKFTENKGQVEIKISSVCLNTDGKSEKSLQKHYVLLTVKDSGIGIGSEDIGHIFDRFYQVDTNRYADIKGTGIGLSLTKELVELHHGFIEVESTVKVGSEFKVFLPLGSGHLKQDEISLNISPDNLSDKSLNDLDYITFEEETVAKTRNEDNRTRKDLPVVLVVEDNKDLRNYITTQLKDYYNIIEASDGRDGFEKTLERNPDLVISDVMMPELSGYELCRKIKSDERTSHIPFLLLSAKVAAENQKEGFEIGADYYLTKPFDAELLLLRIRNIIRSRGKLQDHFLKNNKFLEPKKLNITPSEETFLREAMDCIEKNMSNSEFSVEQFGEVLGISRMQLYRKLKNLTGLSANEFIRSIRLKRAAQLLDTGQLTISEITYEVGFSDLKYFRACFKKEFGVNPSQYNSRSTAIIE